MKENMRGSRFVIFRHGRGTLRGDGSGPGMPVALSVPEMASCCPDLSNKPWIEKIHQGTVK